MSTENKAVKHTPGAVRAAGALFDTNGNWPKSEAAFNQVVAIIDRETAAPELLEALERGYDLTFRLLTMVTHGKPIKEDAKAWMNFAGAAIKKAKGEAL